MSALIAALAATAVFADPFSGVLVEGALGSSALKGDGQTVNLVTGEGAGAPRGSGLGTTTGSMYLNDEKKTNFSSRLGVGYGYTFPGINFNLTGLLTYNIGKKRFNEGVTQINGSALRRFPNDNADLNSSAWPIELKDAFELRLQPGYYILPLRTLVYGTVGYARAKVDFSGQRISNIIASNSANGPSVQPVGDGSVNLNGMVFGLGAKFAPIPLIPLYVGIDYSRASYNSKKINGQTSVDASGLGNGFFPALWQRETGKIKIDTYMITVGYSFF